MEPALVAATALTGWVEEFGFRTAAAATANSLPSFEALAAAVNSEVSTAR